MKFLKWKYKGLDDVYKVEYDEHFSGTIIQLPKEENNFNFKVSSGMLTVLDCYGMIPDFIELTNK